MKKREDRDSATSQLHGEAGATTTAAAVEAQDLGPYPLPAPSCTVLSSVDGGHACGGFAAGGGSAPADPAAQEELFVDDAGTSAVWRSLGGQVAHTSFRSVVLGPMAALEGGLRGAAVPGAADGGGHGAIAQAVRCRFPTLLEGWSSTREGGGRGQERQQQRQRRRQRRRRGPWSVCILRNPDLITVHHPRGDSYDVTLPCEARLLQPLGEGLLVQRFAGTSSSSSSSSSRDGLEFSSAAYGREPEDGAGEEDCFDPSLSVPSLFTLLHPLDELRPVALLPPALAPSQSRDDGVGGSVVGGGVGGGGGGGVSGGGSASLSASPLFPEAAEEPQQQRLVCDASERVVFARGGGDGGTGRDSSLLLTYHVGHRRHSLWVVLPVPEPEPEPEREEPEPAEQSEPLLATVGDISMSGSTLMDQSPGGAHSWAATTGLSSTRGAADASSLSSTLLGVSALKSPSSAAGISMMDAVLDSGNPRRDRLSAGGSAGRGRLSAGGGAGRRTSTGSNASWIGAGNTRNEALATALGLGQSALGVASNLLSLSAPTGHGGGGSERGGGGADSFLTRSGLNASSSVAFGETLAHPEDEEEEEEEEEGKAGHQPIRPHLGISLVWREGEDSLRPAQHVFCAEGAGGGGAYAEADAAESADSSPAGTFLLCFVDGQAASLRALSVSFSEAGGSGDEPDGGVRVAEAFTLPCRAAVGLCATGGGEGEGTPAAAIAADILVLALDGSLVLYRGKSPVTRVAAPPATAVSPGEQPGDDGDGEPELVSEAVGSCFTLTTRDGTRRRLRLSLDPASPLVSACLGAWDSMLSAPLAASLRADVAGAAHALAGPREERPIAAVPAGDGAGRPVEERGVDGDLEWAALVSVVRDLVAGGGGPVLSATRPGRGARRDGSGVAVEGAEQMRDGDDGDAWSRLLASPFHDEFSRSNVLMLSGLRHHSARSAGEGSPPLDGLPDSEAPPQQREQGLLQTRRPAFLAEAGAAFDALHLVLEDLKTSRLTLSLVPRLASLLLSLTRLCGGGGAGMRDFADHYWRDAAGCGQGGGETSSMVDLGGRTGEMGKEVLPNRLSRFVKVRVRGCRRRNVLTSRCHRSSALLQRHRCTRGRHLDPPSRIILREFSGFSFSSLTPDGVATCGLAGRSGL